MFSNANRMTIEVVLFPHNLGIATSSKFINSEKSQVHTLKLNDLLCNTISQGSYSGMQKENIEVVLFVCLFAVAVLFWVLFTNFATHLDWK